MARAAFVHAVFCVRIAPTIVSNGPSPGHQPCGPWCDSRRSYIVASSSAMRAERPSERGRVVPCARCYQPPALGTLRAMSAFIEQLDAAAARNRSLLCVGLDPSLSAMPIDSIAEFNRAIIAATSDLVCAYKPQWAFYEAEGISGIEALQATIEAVPDGVPVLLDAKRGDMDNTSKAYAKAAFEAWGADALTVNPYQGRDAVQPFLDYADRGVFILTRTSNPGSAEFQDLRVRGNGVEGRSTRRSRARRSRGTTTATSGSSSARQCRTSSRGCGASSARCDPHPRHRRAGRRPRSLRPQRHRRQRAPRAHLRLAQRHLRVEGRRLRRSRPYRGGAAAQRHHAELDRIGKPWP